MQTQKETVINAGHLSSAIVAEMARLKYRGEEMLIDHIRNILVPGEDADLVFLFNKAKPESLCTKKIIKISLGKK